MRHHNLMIYIDFMDDKKGDGDVKRHLGGVEIRKRKRQCKIKYHGVFFEREKNPYSKSKEEVLALGAAAVRKVDSLPPS